MRRHGSKCKPRLPASKKQNPGGREVEQFESHTHVFSEMVEAEMTKQMNTALEKIELQIISQVPPEMMTIMKDIVRETTVDTDFFKKY